MMHYDKHKHNKDFFHHKNDHKWIFEIRVDPNTSGRKTRIENQKKIPGEQEFILYVLCPSLLAKVVSISTRAETIRQ